MTLYIHVHIIIYLALPASPVPGIDHYGDDDLPTIPEEVVPDELSSEVCVHVFIDHQSTAELEIFVMQEKFYQLPLALVD